MGASTMSHSDIRGLRRHPAKGLQQAPVVKPIDPFERGEFDGLASLLQATLVASGTHRL
jgi:hypothetical protein